MRLGSAADPLRWYISQPAKCGPLTSQVWRLPSDVRTNAPLRVPTSTRTLLIGGSFGRTEVRPYVLNSSVQSSCVIVIRQSRSSYSDRSAWMTSTRDARAAGISEASTAAATRSTPAPTSGSIPGSCTSVM